MNDDEYGDGGIDWLQLPFLNGQTTSTTNAHASRLEDAADVIRQIQHHTKDLSSDQYKENTSMVRNSVELELREEIQRLNELLKQRDDNLFCLESSLATVEVEAKHAISLAESSALVKVRQLEEDIRRMTKEADMTRLDMIKTKQAYQQQMQLLQKDIQLQKQLPSLQQTQLEVGDDLHHRGRESAVSHAHGPSPRNTGDSCTAAHSQLPHHIDSKLSYDRATNATNVTRSSLTAAKLLQQINTFHPEGACGIYGSEVVNNLVRQMAIVPSLQIVKESSGNLMTSRGLVRELMRELILDLDGFSKGRLRSENTKELGFEPFFPIKDKKRRREDTPTQKEDTYESKLSSHHQKIPLLHSAQCVLNVFLDFLTVSAEARQELRAALSACHGLNEFASSLETADSKSLNSSSIRDPTRALSRIRGLSLTDKSRAAWISTIIDVNEGSSGCDISSHEPGINTDEEFCRLCFQFMRYMSDIITGLLPSSVSFQVSIASFLLTLIIDCYPETSKFDFSSEMVMWRVILSVCFPYSKPSLIMNSSNRDIVNILECALSDQPDYARRRYALLSSSSTTQELEATTGSAFNCYSLVNESIDSKNEILSLKILTIQLLITTLQSSRSARDVLMHNPIQEPHNYHSEVTHTRRIVAALLDDLQAFVLPLLSSPGSLYRHDESSSTILYSVLDLCIHSVRLMSLLCEFDIGFTLVRTRMKSVTRQDGSIKDALPAITIVVDMLTLSGRTLIRSGDESLPLATSISQNWSVLLEECLVFFKLCLNHIQWLRKMIDEGKKSKRELVTLNAILIEAERKESFCSVCRRLLVTRSALSQGVFIEEGSYQRIVALLDEIAFDEEDEEIQQ